VISVKGLIVLLALRLIYKILFILQNLIIFVKNVKKKRPPNIVIVVISICVLLVMEEYIIKEKEGNIKLNKF
jgi:hypothetical protein